MTSITKWIEEYRITEVECLMPDITGNARGKVMPASKFEREEMKLPEGILIQAVHGEWSDDYWELVDPTDRDMIMRPDPDTLCLVPWWDQEPTAQVIHDAYTPEGELHPLAVRSVLRRVLKRYEELGLRPVVAPEVEFYLVAKESNPDFGLKPPIGRSGRPETARQSYSIDAVNEFDPVFEVMYDYCEAQGIDVDALIHESGAAQMEINFLHGDALRAADQVFMFKRIMREAAMRHDIYATFMAKPMKNEPGSALHFHQSLLSVETGENVFSDENGEETELFHHYIAGLQKYSPALMPFFAPNVNSYRRIAPEISAPTSLHWGYDNRTVGLRVPLSGPEARRIENRFPGADANPYLAIAATLTAGLLGMEEKLKPTDAYVGNAYDEPIGLPRSLEEALRLLDECDEVKGVIGEQFCQAYHSVKMTEFEAFQQVISSWEREYLLLSV